MTTLRRTSCPRPPMRTVHGRDLGVVVMLRPSNPGRRRPPLKDSAGSLGRIVPRKAPDNGGADATADERRSSDRMSRDPTAPLRSTTFGSDGGACHHACAALAGGRTPHEASRTRPRRLPAAGRGGPEPPGHRRVGGGAARAAPRLEGRGGVRAPGRAAGRRGHHPRHRRGRARGRHPGRGARPPRPRQAAPARRPRRGARRRRRGARAADERARAGRLASRASRSSRTS